MNKKRGTILRNVALCAIVIATMIRPGDAPWINDEPQMMKMAFYYSHHASAQYGLKFSATPAPYGVMGTRGMHYGPLPIWIDQILLIFTHNPMVMLAVRAGLFTLLTAVALVWLARLMEVNPWLAVVTMLSPWLWFYSRQLWDNSLCIPLSAVALAAYADFLKSRRGASLRLALISASMLPLIHLMSVALIFPLALHFFIVEYQQVWKFKGSLLAIFIVWAGASWPYWHFTFGHFHKDLPWDSSATLGFFYPLHGGRHLTAAGLENILGDDWRESNPASTRNILTIAIEITRLAYLAIWTGAVLAIPKAWRAIRHPTTARPIEHLCAISLATLVCQSLLDGFEHVYEGPHYFNATWMVYLIFAWISVERVQQFLKDRKIPSLGLLPVYAMSLLVVVVIIAIRVAHDGGTLSENYGASLSSQFEAATQINRFSPQSPVITQFKEWTDRPHSPEMLLKLAPKPPGDRPVRILLIRLRNAFPNDARIAVENFPLAGAPATQPADLN